MSLMQWEANGWTKIALKANSEQEIRQIALKAKEENLSHFVLERPVTKMV